MNRALRRKQTVGKNRKKKGNALSNQIAGLPEEKKRQVILFVEQAKKAYLEKRYPDAEKYSKAALTLHPKLAEPYHILGSMALHFKFYQEAGHYLEQALKINPELPVTLNNYGIYLRIQERHEEALKYFSKATLIEPKYHDAINNKGAALAVLGRMEQAQAQYEKAAKIKPLFGKAYNNLVLAGKIKPGSSQEKLLEKAEALLPMMEPVDQINTHFALGKFYEDKGNYETGFSHFLKANKLQFQTRKFSMDETEKVMKNTELVFPAKEKWVEKTDVGCQSSQPLFILGMPRSGTTLVEQILSSHSKVHGAGELRLMANTIDNIDLTNKGFYPKGSDDLAAFEKQVNKLGTSYADEMRKLGGNIRYVTDKMPHNFRYIGLIHAMLPNAKIIHCRRHPVDVCLSNFRILFMEGMEYTYDLTEMGRYYMAYDRIMAHWEKVFPDKFLTVQYEDTVADIEQQARRILNYCDLDWEEKCLEFHKTKRSVHTASSSQVRRPIYKDSVGRYERYGDLLKPLLEVLSPVL
ncbi:MAG: sulfotransferase [Sneathiellales bacterium]|nr:sulfotransferase [Sneathiellales bacterium]